MSTNYKIGILVGLIFTMAAPAMPQYFRSNTSPLVTVEGGHGTAEIDHGRPVALVAGGLGVPPQVFRDAFSHVTPAPDGREPDPEQVRRNKQALLNALAKYGVTNELLDKVSDYYRYRPGRGNLWAHKDASVEVVMNKDVVTGFKIVDGGAGYSTAPTVSVQGHPEIRAVATVAFGKDLAKNGSISKIEIVKK